MKSAYNLNLYIKDTFAGSLECPLHTGLIVSIYTQYFDLPIVVNLLYTVV